MRVPFEVTSTDSEEFITVSARDGESVTVAISNDSEYAEISLTTIQAREIAVRMAQAAVLADQIPAHVLRDMG